MSGITLNLLSAAFGTLPVGYLAVINSPDSTNVSPANVSFNSSHVYLGVQNTTAFPDSFSQATVLKITPEGAIVWQTGLTDGLDYYTLSGITNDASGNVVLTGSKYDSAGDSFSGYVAKLNSSGVLQWRTRINAVRTFLFTPACDSSENIYCGGYLQAVVGRSDSYIVKLNSSGALQFGRQIGDPTSGSEELTYQIVTDSTHIYTVGDIDRGNPDAGSDRLLCTTGETTNGFFIQDGVNAVRQSGSSICTDGSGTSSYVAVRVYETLSSGSRQTAVVARINYGTGTFTWQNFFFVTSASTDIVGMCLNAAGNSLYVCGTVYGTPTKILLLKINASNGVLVWQRTLSSTTENLRGVGITIDASENIYVSGSALLSPSPQRVLLLKVPGDGTGLGAVTIGGVAYTYAASTDSYGASGLNLGTNIETNTATSYTTVTPTAVNTATSCTLTLGTL